MIEYLTFFLVWFIFMTLLAIFYYMRRELKRAKEKCDIYEKWVFDSFYSLNANVKLPDGKGKTVFKAAIVTSDKTDPMGEFDGRHDDWFT